MIEHMFDLLEGSRRSSSTAGDVCFGSPAG